MSRLYRTAMLPGFRKVTGVTMDPFAGTPREPTEPRITTITADALRPWIANAP